MAQSLPSIAGGWKNFSDLVCNKLTEKSLSFLEKYLGAELIIVTGSTGVGKSSFIKLITGQDVYIGSRLESGTTKTALVPAVIDGKNYLFLDMPGFNANDLDDWHIFTLLMTAMATVRRYVRFRGVLYVDTMNDTRLTAPTEKMLTWLALFCGPDFMPNVTVVTTRWDGLDRDGIQDKLDRYETWHTDELSRRFFSYGAMVYHHGLIQEQDGYRTLHLQKSADERQHRALQMIQDHYGSPTNLTMQICDEIAHGCAIQTTSAGHWLRNGSTNQEASPVDSYPPSASSSEHVDTRAGEQARHRHNESRGGGDGGYRPNVRKESQNPSFWSSITFEDVKPWISVLFKAASVYMRASSPSTQAEWHPSESDMFDDMSEFEGDPFAGPHDTDPFEGPSSPTDDSSGWCVLM